MNLQRQVGVVLRSLPLLAAAALLTALPVYYQVNAQARVYQASSMLLVGQALQDANPDYLGLEVSRTLAGTYAWLVSTDGQLERVIDRLGLDQTPESLRPMVDATVREADSVITISARDQDPGRAAAIADAAAAELIAMAPTIDEGSQRAAVQADLTAMRADIDRTQARLDSLLGLGSPTAAQQAEIERLRGQLVDMRSTYTGLLGYGSDGGANSLTLIQPAVIPTASVEPRPLYFALVAAMTGLILAVALVFLLEWRDDRLRGGQQVEEITGLPVLAAIPNVSKGRGGPWLYEVGSAAWNAVDALRIATDSLVPQHDLSSIVVVSPSPHEGRTTLAANLAVAFANAGRPVLLVDADVVDPRLHLVFGTDDRFGLATLVRSETANVMDLAKGTPVPGLRLLSSGRAAADGVPWRSGGVEQVIDRLRSIPGELIIYDVPSLDSGTVALGLAARAEATLLVARLQKTSRSRLRDACNMLDLVHARVIGVAVQGLRSIPSAPEVVAARKSTVDLETPVVAYGAPPRVG